MPNQIPDESAFPAPLPAAPMPKRTPRSKRERIIDPVADVRALRKAIAARYDYDPVRMAEDDYAIPIPAGIRVIDVSAVKRTPRKKR